MMAEDRASNIQADASAAVSEPVVPTARPTEETPALPEVPSARPISELTTSEEFSEERNRLDQLVQQNTITRQEQLDLLGELRDRERELAEAAYQARQFVGPPVPTAVPTAAPVPVPTAVPTAAPVPVPTAVPTAAPVPVPTAVPTAAPVPVPTAVPTAAPVPVPTLRPTEETPAPPEVPIARELRITTERENNNRRIQLAREGHSRSEIEAMMAADSGSQSAADSESTPTARPTEETPAPPEVPIARTPDESEPVTANVSATENYEQRLAELTDQYFNESLNRNPINGSTESLKQSARRAANIKAREELQKEIDQGLLQSPRDRVGFTDNMLNSEPQTPDEIASLTTPAAPTVTQAAPRALAPAIETPTPAQVTTAITPAPVVQPTQPTTPVVTTTTTAQANNANANTDINDIMSLLSYKLDAVIDLLGTGVTIQDRILLESRS
jgi:hypothetical protein